MTTARGAMEQEVRTLVQDLHNIQTTLKPGSVEREQREDYIYQRLYQLAETIKTHHATDPQLRELYFVITDQGAPTDSVSVRRLPIYTDEFKLFTQSPTTPRVQLFLEKMATDLKSVQQDTLHQWLSDQTRDGPKDVLRTFVSKCDREQWLQDSAKRTCKDCWEEVMRYVFMMAIELLTVEMKQRAQQIRTLTERGYLTEVDAEDLVKHMENILIETTRLLETAKQSRQHSKREWINLVEALFRLLVGLINDIMLRYMQFIHFRRDHAHLEAAAAVVAAPR